MLKRARSFALVLAPAVWGCATSGGGGSPSPASRPPTGESGPSAASTATSSPAASPLPAPSFAALPGWLGFATRNMAGGNGYAWSASSTKGNVVVLGDAWSEGAGDTRLAGVSSVGVMDLVLVGHGAEPYGCDDNTVPMTTFLTSENPPEGPVWVVTREDSAALAPLPLTPKTPADLPPALRTANLQDPKNARVVGVGSYLVVLEKVDAAKGTLTVVTGTTKLHEAPFQKHVMAGAPVAPLDVNVPGEVGVPQPIGAFRFGDVVVAVILWVAGYEGNSFQVLRITGQEVESLDGPYLYLCAY